MSYVQLVRLGILQQYFVWFVAWLRTARYNDRASTSRYMKAGLVWMFPAERAHDLLIHRGLKEPIPSLPLYQGPPCPA